MNMVGHEYLPRQAVHIFRRMSGVRNDNSAQEHAAAPGALARPSVMHLDEQRWPLYLARRLLMLL